VNLGDIASGPLWPRETVRWLMARDWTTLAGNHERQVLTLPRARMGPSDAFAASALGRAERAWLAALPTVARPLTATVRLCHGTPTSDLDYLMETVTADFGVDGSPGLRAASAAELQSRLGPVDPAATLLLCGHTHLPRALLAGRLQIVNPGSVGLPAYDDVHPHPHFVETGSPLARWALVEAAPGGWRVALCSTPYDTAAAARRATANGRPDWADALASGRVGRTEATASRPGS